MRHQVKNLTSLLCFIFTINALSSQTKEAARGNVLEKRASFDWQGSEQDYATPSRIYHDANSDVEDAQTPEYEAYTNAYADPSNVPWDDLYFAKKAAAKAYTDETAAMKWLGRAEGVLTSDPKITNLHYHQYEEKLSEATTRQERQKATKKRDFWMGLSQMLKDTKMIEYIMNAGNRYEEEAHALLEQYVRLQGEEDTTEEDLQATEKRYREVIKLNRDWDHATSKSQALKNCQAELSWLHYATIKEQYDGNQGRYVEEMRAHAIDAIAWSIKARKLN